jgi:hypothetical protein
VKAYCFFRLMQRLWIPEDRPCPDSVGGRGESGRNRKTNKPAKGMRPPASEEHYRHFSAEETNCKLKDYRALLHRHRRGP